MSYDTPTVQVLRTVLDEVLLAPSSPGSEIVQRLKLRSAFSGLLRKGNGSLVRSEAHLLNEFLARTAA
ncbi:hypothetical protein ABIF68_004085 [Bradyrhizobium japonicum]|jgi:hypothetical protein|nr:hypothetical protein [Bradyrhizobium japonicum]MCP1794686.1 hypothetical protein [Bradyrhizobium japonicum]MCP1811048.1 hypothetical protein [Bradyrhizobium japonicum]MCP1821099.1 hypothetical protein [Bradyrhizobium japonicum]MCP1876135.1 hypothetical protein [Bradyrhizobium japonicum]